MISEPDQCAGHVCRCAPKQAQTGYPRRIFPNLDRDLFTAESIGVVLRELVNYADAEANVPEFLLLIE